MRSQLVKNEKEIIKLTSEKQKYFGGSGKYHTDDLLKRIKDKSDE